MAKEEISLLPQQGLIRTSLGRITDWLLSTGRYLAIFVDLIVIGAFLSRFWLDRKNSDLSEQIRQQKAILEATQDFEKEFRLFQARLTAIDQAIKKESHPLLPLEIISQSLPQDIVLLTYSFAGQEKNEANISALVYSESGLAQFVSNLLSHEEVARVRIGTIEREEGVVGMKIQFSIGFKNLGKQKNGAEPH